MIYIAPVAQLDRVSGYEPEGRAFESLRVHQELPHHCAHRLAVRTLPFHGGNRGSIPRGRTTFYSLLNDEQAVLLWGFVIRTPF